MLMPMSLHVNNPIDCSPTQWLRDVSDTAKKLPSKNVPIYFLTKIIECPIPHSVVKAIILFTNLWEEENFILVLVWTLFLILFVWKVRYISLRVMKIIVKFVYMYKHWTKKIPFSSYRLIAKLQETWKQHCHTLNNHNVLGNMKSTEVYSFTESSPTPWSRQHFAHFMLKETEARQVK